MKLLAYGAEKHHTVDSYWLALGTTSEGKSVLNTFVDIADRWGFYVCGQVGGDMALFFALKIGKLSFGFSVWGY